MLVVNGKLQIVATAFARKQLLCLSSVGPTSAHSRLWLMPQKNIESFFRPKATAADGGQLNSSSSPGPPGAKSKGSGGAAGANGKAARPLAEILGVPAPPAAKRPRNGSKSPPPTGSETMHAASDGAAPATYSTGTTSPPGDGNPQGPGTQQVLSTGADQQASLTDQQGTGQSPAAGAGAVPQEQQAGQVAPSTPSVLLSPAECQHLVDQACELAAAQGRQPRLAELLVEPSWKAALAPEFKKEYWGKLGEFVTKEWAGKAQIFPPKPLVFRAFNSCPLDKVKVVILGQDPYHRPGQAHGLCFSVNRGVTLPPSLRNIYKELNEDLGLPIPKHGDLSSWTEQGVLLLNTVLTVRTGEANSHQKKGWEAFTDAAIQTISRQRKGVVFMLWGKPAQTKEKLITGSRHHVLKAPHPSPLAGASGHVFVGCRHFSQANKLLAAQPGSTPIDWALPE